MAPLPSASSPALTADAGVGVSEVQARQELDTMFRQAGFRVLNDEPLLHSHIEMVLDGYDPEQKVGYEYIDSREAAESISRKEGDALSRDSRILIVRSCSIDELRHAASSFLERTLVASDAGLPSR
ncbi:MAG: hypothetical protein GY811_12325 [Myxococcales bacterium]|nr:hypothetical protein [Myxococcales bacterium]